MADSKDTTTNVSKDSKIYDVAKPGESAPSTTSKQIIVTNHPVLTDPMVVENRPTATTDEPATSTSVPPSVSRLKIEPISKAEDLKPSSKEQPTTDSPEETTITQDTSDDEADGDQLKDASSEEQQLIDSKAAEHQANLEKIALAKTYYLPINQVVRRRSKHVVLAGAALIIVLGIAWADVALDAGLITIPGLKAPTHFFK